MVKVSRSRRICNNIKSSRSVSVNPVVVDPSIRKTTFPTDIKELLILLAEDEGENEIDIVLKSSCPDYCFLCNVDPIAVFDNTLVIRVSEGCSGKFMYIDICCICTVSFKCSVLLNELFEAHNISGE
jgi:hypothetical protein